MKYNANKRFGLKVNNKIVELCDVPGLETTSKYLELNIFTGMYSNASELVKALSDMGLVPASERNNVSIVKISNSAIDDTYITINTPIYHDGLMIATKSKLIDVFEGNKNNKEFITTVLDEYRKDLLNYLRNIRNDKQAAFYQGQVLRINAMIDMIRNGYIEDLNYYYHLINELLSSKSPLEKDNFAAYINIARIVEKVRLMYKDQKIKIPADTNVYDQQIEYFKKVVSLNTKSINYDDEDDIDPDEVMFINDEDYTRMSVGQSDEMKESVAVQLENRDEMFHPKRKL